VTDPRPADDPELEAELLEEQIPALATSPYTVESESTTDYNCIGWALGDCCRYWSPALEGGYHWPKDLPLGIPVVDVVATVFRRAGYVECSDATFEPGVEKVVIYADDLREVRHAARQLPDGRWASKMGDLADINHEDLEPLEGAFFGKVTLIMARDPNAPASQPDEPAFEVVRHGSRPPAASVIPPNET
jgi:hypothetical protein